MTEKDKEDIKKAVVDGLQAAIGELYIDRKQHYEDHGFIKRFRTGLGVIRKGTLYTLGVSVVTGLIGVVGWAIKGLLATLPGTGGP